MDAMDKHAPPPLLQARIGGAMYLIIIAIGLFEEVFVRSRLVVADAIVTAANIRAHELLWRASVAAELFAAICVTVLMLTWVAVLGPVSRQLTLLAALFAIMAHGVETTAALDLLTALFPLGNAPYLQAFTPEQLAALAKLSIRAHGHGFGFSLMFSGCFFVIAGYLMRRSGYVPRWIGVLYQIAGTGYITHTFALVLAPAFADRLFLVVAGPILVGETSLSLYLLIKGVDVAGWNRRQAALAAAGEEPGLL